MITKLNKDHTELNNSQTEKSNKILLDKYCHRCGGLMISEHCFDIQSHTGEFDILIRKCLSCGETIDPTILKNRYQAQQIFNGHILEPHSVNCPPASAEGTAEEHPPSK